MTREQHYSLKQLNQLVADAVAMHLPDEYWVEAELSECRENRGHCYMELVEKTADSHTPVARAQAKCWRQTYAVLAPYFERTTGQPLRAGLKVMLRVYAQFHEAYGFSWIVTDIDPAYTLGDIARRRQEIIAQLKAEGIFDLQHELRLPTFCQRIAVVSAASAAGYGDFCRQLADNQLGLRFAVELFPAVMQGEQVEQSIIAALDAINAAADRFDCVVIIRGGGAVADLSGFDTLALAENVAQFPLPIITGIGHERDETVLDVISYARVKTPTAAATLLADHLTQVWTIIERAEQTLTQRTQQRLELEQMRLARLAEALPQRFLLVKQRQESRLEQLLLRATTAIGNRLQREHHRLELLTQRTEAQDPQHILARGYTITRHNGRAVRRADQLPRGAEIETLTAQGTLHSIVT